jgi:L-threonylcarbamoyladenylate synthase
MDNEDIAEAALPQKLRADIERAAELLRRGGLVAFPTETVYGLGADASSDAAVARIFEAKGRPQFNPLIVHVANMAAAEALGCFSKAARALANALWPGALTLVVNRTPQCPVSALASAGLATLALRVPAHPVARALLTTVDLPVAAPSANRSGTISPTLAAHVRTSLGDRVDFVVDGGACPIGLESTIVDCTGDAPVILRFGGIGRARLEEVLGTPVKFRDVDGDPTAPGQLSSHYAPRARLRLNVHEVLDGEALLGFGPDLPPHQGPALNLSEAGDLLEAAANLFAHLHALDAAGVSGIAAMPVPAEGLGEAINDRLVRAAAPRNA